MPSPVTARSGLITRSVIGLAAAAALTFGAMQAQAQEKSTATLRVASVLAEQSAMSVAIKKWAEAVTQRTDGRIQFR